MKITAQHQRNAYIIFFSVITIAAVYGMYTNSITNKLNLKKLDNE